MDRLSALGAVGSLLTVIETSAKLTSSLYRLARGIHAAKKNIDDFALHVSTFSDVLFASHSCLYDHYTKRTDLRILNNVQRKNLLGKIAERAERIQAGLNKIRPRMKSLRPDDLQLIVKIKWHFRRPEVESLKLQMTSLEQTLNTLISIVNYELLEQQGGDPIRSNILLRQMKNHTKALGVLAAKINGVIARDGPSSYELLNLSEMQDIIGNVVARKIESVHRERRAIERPEVDEVPIQHAPRVSRHRPRSQRARGADPHRMPSTTPLATPDQTIPAHIPEPEHGTDEMDRTVTTDNAPVAQLANPEPRQPLAESISSSTDVKVIVGNIFRETSRPFAPGGAGQPVTARLYENFARSIMSQNLAMDLGLEIRPIVAEIDMPLKTRLSGLISPITMVGHVYFVWTTGSLAFRVRCSVVEENEFLGGPLVFGRPFVDSRDSARRARRGNS